LRIIPHTDKMIRDAHNRAFRLGSLNNSILKGRGNASGYMGEEALAAYLGAKIVSDEQYDYDLVVGGRNVEVKTKQRTVPPKGEYDVSIAATSRHQKPDLYAFISLEFKSSDNTSGPLAYQDLEYVWLLGYKRPEDYFRDAELWMPGDMDSNGFQTHREMFNLPVYKLDRPPSVAILPAESLYESYGKQVGFWGGQ
jgi:hypothetical protein